MKEMVGGCCVCSDDRGWSENPLVYCDGQSCAVAVHQACYGIVTVPSGPWYCRKCESQERSARVRCELCPSRDGALKRTDNQGWAHVVCALYIPEVRFGNVTTMEPIILQLIPQERYNKTCYICQEMGKGSRSTAGACMQCNKSGCKQQFHVTCAQQLGLLCEEAGNYLDNVKYCGYCQHHYSKLKKGGNVKTIPPYKPISHETNSSDAPSSPEKELEPLTSGQQHSSGNAMGGSNNSGSGNMKSNSRMPGGEMGGSSSATASSSSSKQRKSSSATKSSTGSSSNSGPSSGMVSGGSGSLGTNSQSMSSSSSGMVGMGSGSTGSSSMPGSNNKTSASSSSGSTKEKDKYSKNVNKVSGTNKGHDKEPSSSSSSSSSSSQRDKSSKSSKSSGATSNTGGLGSSTNNTNSVSSSLGNSLPKENDPLSSSVPSTMSSSSSKHQDSIKQEKTLAQISSAAASSARAASLSPAAIPTTLIIKPPHDHSGSNKELLSKEAIAKFTTSNFTETIVVNSDSVFGTSSTSSSSNSNSNNSGPANNSTNQSSGSNVGPNVAPTSVIENTSGSNKQLNMSGGGNSSYSGSGVAKKRKADARSTPTSIASGDIDINRDLIKDVAVSLVPLPLNKNDNIDPASLSGFEKSIKKAKTEPHSPLQPTTTTTGDPNLQNVSPNLVQQTHGTNVISSSSIKHQSQSNSPQLQQQQHQVQQQQQQQQQNQPHTPSLVVSVPLSTATVPGINLPTSNSGSSGSSSTPTSSSNTNSNSNAPPTSSQLQLGSNSSGITSNIISPGQMPPGSSLYQQIAHRSGSDQLLNASTNRSSPVIQQSVPSGASHVIQNAAHSILERHSPSMRSSPSIITSASSQQQHQPPPPQSHNNLFLTAAMDLNTGSGLSAGVSVLQSVSPVPMSAIQSTSSSPITPGGDGGLKITYEKQTPTTNARITALQEQEQQLAGRRSRTPDNSFGSNSSFSGGGGLKFSYEAQTPTTTVLSAAAANPTQMGATSTIITTPQPMVVKESPPSSPGSDTGGATVRGSNKRNRKLSTNSNAGKIIVGVSGPPDGSGPPDAKDSKLFQNGVVHATHMLGNQLNPNSTVAQKMSDQLSMEIDAHSFVETPVALVGPPFPGKSQAARSSNASAPQPAPPSLSSMLSGSGTATANGNTPQSLEQLLERQWEQGSQFLMEQAQHFDIASLLSCLHQLRSENIRLEEHVNNLVARRDHLLAVNARLAIPLNPAALGGVGLGGGGGSGGGGGASGGTGGGPSGTTSGSGTGSVGSQGQFNNMHGNGPHDGSGSSATTASAISSRSSRIQQHQSQQQQQTQSHFGSNSTGQVPMENGIDFRHSNTTHQNTNSSSIRHHSPSSHAYPNSSNRQPQPPSSSATASNVTISSEQQPPPPPPSSHSRRGGTSSSNAPSSNSTSSSSSSAAASVYQSQQQTIYNTAHQIPLLLEHHQQEHHSQQPPPPQQQQPPPPHHLRQTPPTVPSSSRSHPSNAASRGGSNMGPSAHQLHLHHSHPSHHPSSSSTAHAPHPPPQQPQHPQQQPLPQRQRH